MVGLMASTCSRFVPPAPPDHGSDQAGETLAEGSVVFEESFDKCTLSKGPQIQSDDFKNDCQNPLSHVEFKSAQWKTVGSSHVCDDSYIRLRGFADWVYLFRTVENSGCLACGVNSDGKRGIIQSPMLSRLDEISRISVSFSLKKAEGMTDAICTKVVLAGVIVSATLNGSPYELTHSHDGIEHSLVFPSSVLSDGWNEVKLEVEDATDGTMLYWAGESSSSSLNHGFYLDNIKVVKLSAWKRAENNLRVLFWNIQNGMWSDQTAGFNNFRKFIEKYDPDICVWCEGQSIYKDRSTASCAVADRYFPAGWPEFALGYGHKYTAIGGYRIYADDYFPQIVTSKYPITTLVKIAETDEEHQKLAASYTDGASHAADYHATCGENYCPVAHGAAVQQVDVNGTKVNIVTLHLWPHAYSYYAKYVTKQTSDPQSVGGNRQREAEIRYICSKSIEDPSLSVESNWLMMGDFNTRSRKDNWRYKLPEDSPFLSSHDYILDHTFYRDMIAEKWPGQYFATRTWCNDAAGNYPVRYDFMYASPSMMGKVKNAMILNESWTNMVWAMSNYYDSSDHRPILVDFDMDK